MECIYNCGASGIDWPAWVQAVGSVGAIIFAILVPKWNRAAESAERDRKEQNEALALATVMVREFERFRWRIAQEVAKAQAAKPTDAISINKSLIPQVLWENALSLSKLGPSGESALRAIYCVHRARDYQADGKVVREDIRSYRIFLERAEQHANRALTGLRETLDRHD